MLQLYLPQTCKVLQNQKQSEFEPDVITFKDKNTFIHISFLQLYVLYVWILEFLVTNTLCNFLPYSSINQNMSYVDGSAVNIWHVYIFQKERIFGRLSQPCLMP